MLPFNTTTEVLPVAEARRRLDAGVRDLVGRMIEQAEAVAEAQENLVALGKESGRDEEIESRAFLLDNLREALGRTVRRLNEAGAVVKDAERGLIDFYGWRGDEMVFLCWLHGERTITHWHGIESGFAGREPIDGDPEIA